MNKRGGQRSPLDPWLLIITINLEIFFWFVLWGLDRIGIWKWCKRELIIVGRKEGRQEAGIDRATKLIVDLGNSKNDSLPITTPIRYCRKSKHS